MLKAKILIVKALSILSLVGYFHRAVLDFLPNFLCLRDRGKGERKMLLLHNLKMCQLLAKAIQPLR